MAIWMMVSRDKYEHPIVVADTVEELAELCGVKVSSIRSYMSHAKKTGGRCKYIKVEEGDDDGQTMHESP